MVRMAGGNFGDELDSAANGGEHLSMDLVTFYNILDEFSDISQSSPEDMSHENFKAVLPHKASNHKNFQHQSGFLMLEQPHALGSESMGPHTHYPSNNLEASDSIIGGSDGCSDYVGASLMAFDGLKSEPSLQYNPLLQTCSTSLKEGASAFQGDEGTERVGLWQFEIPSCSTSCFAEGDPHRVDGLDPNILLGETGTQVRHVGRDIDSKYHSQGTWMDNLFGEIGYKNSLGISEPENDVSKSVDLSLVDAAISSNDVISSQSTIYHNSDVTSELGPHYAAMQFDISANGNILADSPQYYVPGDFNYEILPNKGEFQTESACSASEISMIDHSDVKGLNFSCEGSNNISPVGGDFSSNPDDRLIDDKASGIPFCYIQSGINREQMACIKDERIDGFAQYKGMMLHSVQAINEADNRESSCGAENTFCVDEDSKQFSTGMFSSMPSQKQVVYTKDGKSGTIIAPTRSQSDGRTDRFPVDCTHLRLNSSELYLPYAQLSDMGNKQMSGIKYDREGNLIQHKGLGFNLSIVSPESIESNSSGSKSHAEEDSDICILEDISHPACSNQSVVHGKAVVPLQRVAHCDSSHYMGGVGMRLRANDERFASQVAMEGLSQPKSEAIPPDGALAVPLLRHQRIALSWMVQKETSSRQCSGGILADDQGLGKTVSTIALILKERPSSLRLDPEVVKKEQFETLDLDEDDDEVVEVYRMKQSADGCQVISDQNSTKVTNSFGQSKGRPAAGTLIVCPTSVLRQWADELHKKVTSEANLSVLVYHGSNRTKNPYELAKYDVVLTTYSIVSMEVPKQPVVDEDEEKRKLEGDDFPPLGYLYGKKRKYPPSSGKKGSKNKKGTDDTLVDSEARPLAKVGWFRIVLDEAQSIKNHRTQVARACWGLRAKRRWCLSGTPIQNAIDDLYSYFRFLRYEPYSSYKLFCSTIKLPIQKNPTKGYRMLQAVLKTIMLRRTKGMLLDGEPIITLPPKVVELKKVDFTEEERGFYTRLETDSRAQFKEYAAAGTVKQNYVNILLMLLRLRQACDHPLLVTGLNSNSLGRPSIEMSKKLPRDRQLHLLNCLEASLAICGICNDPPEDAVVSICGHVFCNQCICEHLTGDDNQCPTSNCKVRLTGSSVFSKATLKSCLSGQPAQNEGSELVEADNSDGFPYDSSKIRAAIEFLQFLTKPQDSTSANRSLESSFDGNATRVDNLSGPVNACDDDADKANVNAEKNANGSIKVVGEKAIVFSQWTRMLDLLEACLKSSSIQYRRLDGTMSVVARDKAVKDFNTLPEVSVMIMSLKAASLGLNMVAACRVLLLDLWWNPTTEDQAIDRAHRIGQTRPVTVLRLTVKDTVEDRILALQQKKRVMVASAFGEDETGSRQTRLTVDDLNYLFMV